jgi:hypothetical protein
VGNGRLGVDDDDSYEQLKQFIKTVHEGTGGRVTHFVVHARKAILCQKLSPEQNRNIPPLRYDLVYRHVQRGTFYDQSCCLRVAFASPERSKNVPVVQFGAAQRMEPRKVYVRISNFAAMLFTTTVECPSTPNTMPTPCQHLANTSDTPPPTQLWLLQIGGRVPKPDIFSQRRDQVVG